ncbi:hypothetical protein Bbelb_201240 [Branchiostoma belcheri]|nr:hypothetical protein Bbelb_201240 [Branchiostoma belcheri]
MPHACDICGKEFSREANLVRHRDTIHGDVTDMSSGKEILDTETGQYRSADIFDDTDNSSDEATTEHDTEPLESSEEEGSMASQDEVSEDESVKDSWEAESTTETDKVVLRVMQARPCLPIHLLLMKVKSMAMTVVTRKSGRSIVTGPFHSLTNQAMSLNA